MTERHVISRRRFLGRVAAGASGLAVGASPFHVLRGARAAGAGKPNVLFIISDEHNASVTGCYGNAIVRTPSLDSLAAEGVLFENAYCNSPLCVPSRLVLTAGKYASRTGAWNNGCWLPSDGYPSLPRIMNAAGYESFLCGKMHYDATRRYGFTELFSRNNATKSGKVGRRRPDNESSNLSSWQGRSGDFAVADTSGVIRKDLEVTDNATRFLRERDAAAPPFFLLCGYLAPHFPLTVPQAFYDPFKDKVPMPVIPPGHLDQLALNYKHLRRGFGVTNPEPDPSLVKFGRELYYGLTSWVDDQIGQLLAALKASPFADNTIVIYTTDHGENIGEHGMWWKNCMFEHAARIPLIVRWPQRWTGGQRRTGACSMVDVVKTVAELGGAETPDDWNGDSLVEWMDTPGAQWKDFALSEYYAHNIASGFVMVRQGRYKYVYHTRMSSDFGPERELYDLVADPGEFTNLARTPGHESQIASMHASMLGELERDPDETEQIAREMGAVGYQRS